MNMINADNCKHLEIAESEFALNSCKNPRFKHKVFSKQEKSY